MNRLARQALAEFVGTALLAAAVVGSGIAAARLSPNQPGLELLVNSIVTSSALVALIVALQPVSAAFNPIVTLIERATGGLSNRALLALICCQLSGAYVGVITSNVMFGLPAINVSAHHRTGGGLLLGEAVATLGLVVVIFGAVRAGRSDRLAFAVGGYILAAYWFTSSTSFANPALTVARLGSDTFAGIAPSSVGLFVAAQVAGGLVGYGVVSALWPVRNSMTSTSATGDALA